MKAAKSNFIQQIEHENNRIKDIIKKPRLVETKFETLIGIHEGIESMINEYFENSKIEIKVDTVKYAAINAALATELAAGTLTTKQYETYRSIFKAE